jgi:hypothetical protein
VPSNLGLNSLVLGLRGSCICCPRKSCKTHFAPADLVLLDADPLADIQRSCGNLPRPEGLARQLATRALSSLAATIGDS